MVISMTKETLYQDTNSCLEKIEDTYVFKMTLSNALVVFKYTKDTFDLKINSVFSNNELNIRDFNGIALTVLNIFNYFIRMGWC